MPINKKRKDKYPGNDDDGVSLKEFPQQYKRVKTFKFDTYEEALAAKAEHKKADKVRIKRLSKEYALCLFTTIKEKENG